MFTIQTLKGNMILQLTAVRKSESAATSGSNIEQNKTAWTRLENMANTIKVHYFSVSFQFPDLYDRDLCYEALKKAA